MKSLILLAVVIALSNASTLKMKAIPSSISIPDSSEVDDFLLSSISTLNNNLMGLSAKMDKEFIDFTGDLFSRPKALVVIQVKGVEEIGGTSSGEYKSTDEGVVDVSSTEDIIKETYGSSAQYNILDGSIVGGKLAESIKSFDVSEDSVKTKIPLLRQELLEVERMIKYLENEGPRLDVSAPEVYNIHISGLLNAIATPKELEAAQKEVEKVLDQLTEVFKKIYGEQVIVEVISTSADQENVEKHSIYKRDTQANGPMTIQEIRKKYNVYSFTQGDYPAIFAIFAGVSIILAVAVLFIAVGMWTMDPGKDSIIYRMTTTKLKKD
uniref:Renin receptor n=1 Tax=Strongyloides papillosus TaxID=174720 RepID=A0A0N5C7C4_STREA